jgi:hypothetical protein
MPGANVQQFKVATVSIEDQVEQEKKWGISWGLVLIHLPRITPEFR